jgi:glycyl-tRNA synthetase beta chain
LPTNEFLLEIGSEEIPDWMIEPALADLARLLAEGFQKLRLVSDGAPHIETYATPRRLVAYTPSLPDRQPDTEELLTGPPVKAPAQAKESFARKMDVDPAKLQVSSTPKGEYWAFQRKEKGKKTAKLLRTLLPDVIGRIYFPKTMYWTGKNGPRFTRPIRSLLALYDGRVVPFTIAGVKSGAYTFGHRVLGKPRIKVTGFQHYVEELKNNGVVLKAAERREKILADAARALGPGSAGVSPAGFRLRENPALLNTLVYLAEFPTADMGQFDPAYLELPEEVLVTVMQHHQKYLPVSDARGKLAPRFIFVMNLDGDSTGVIRHGNQRVLRARFNDARFFWETDQKVPLRDRLPLLEHVRFQARLGNYREKTERNVALVRKLSRSVPQASVEHAVRGAELAKTDLTTELVKEFTELQGIVGGLYAKAQGEPPAVADAIYDHYKPESMDDRSPRTPEGALLALADKLDTLAGCFSIGLKPTGSSDPFALRRAAQGVVKILADHRLHAPLDALIQAAFAVQQSRQSPRRPAGAGEAEGGGAEPGEDAGVRRELRDFFLDRLRYYLREVRGFRYDEVNAVLAVGCDDIVDAIERCQALQGVRPTPNFEPLSAAFKRIKNILAKAGGVGAFTGEPDAAALEPGAEADLYNEARRIFDEVSRSADYSASLARIAELRPAVDTFFDKVLVMAKDENVRRNRLTMLAWLLRAFTRVADFSEIATERA